MNLVNFSTAAGFKTLTNFPTWRILYWITSSSPIALDIFLIHEILNRLAKQIAKDFLLFHHRAKGGWARGRWASQWKFLPGKKLLEICITACSYLQWMNLSYENSHFVWNVTFITNILTTCIGWLVDSFNVGILKSTYKMPKLRTLIGYLMVRYFTMFHRSNTPTIPNR